jgi:histidine ammonia-lyase
MDNTIVFAGQNLTVEDIVQLANPSTGCELSQQPAFVDKINKGARFLERLLEEDGFIYGVTTGYGDSCTVSISPDLVNELPLHLVRFHGCGMGRVLDVAQSRAVMATRMASLCQGYSGVRWQLLEQIARFLNYGISPVIPEEGSVGASGDLTPLSYLAATLIGERDVIYRNQRRPASEVLAQLDISPLTLHPKESLALMNGTAVMTALACLAYDRAEYLSRLVTRITAMVSVGLQGNANHFDPLLFSVKSHPGQNQVAARIHGDLNAEQLPRNARRLQDRYSVRCAPHIIGVLADSLPWMRQFIENELNSANDNPIIDAEGEHVMHGGHFYGGHIAFVMDALKNAVANLADLLDRQMALLMDVKFNQGLPANLSGASATRAMINHGFKAVQIATSAWTAEALKLTMPASVFSRSTECHNQDKVSMGTIAARDCLRILELTEQVASAVLLAATQAIQLRQRQRELSTGALSTSLSSMQQQVSAKFDFLDEDRPLESALRDTVARIQSKAWSLYE